MVRAHWEGGPPLPYKIVEELFLKLHNNEPKDKEDIIEWFEDTTGYHYKKEGDVFDNEPMEKLSSGLDYDVLAHLGEMSNKVRDGDEPTLYIDNEEGVGEGNWMIECNEEGITMKQLAWVEVEKKHK